MDVGIAYDLKSSFEKTQEGPIDRLEEYDEETTVVALEKALAILGHQPRRLRGGRALLEEVLQRPPELVFNIAEGYGSRSREAHVPAVLEMLGIPFTHSDPLTLALALDKGMTKQVVAAAGVPTPDFAVIRTRDDLDRVALPFPLVAKPLFEGSSIGVRLTSKVRDRAALRAEVERLLTDYAQPVLVEAFCPGMELTVGVLCREGVPTVLGVMEIAPRKVSNQDFVYSLEVKRNYLQEVEYLVPPRLPVPVIEEAGRVALAVFTALDCRDVARVDLRLDAAGQPRFIEINPLPGVNPVTSDLCILARGCGWTYEQLVGGIVQSARHRYAL